MKQRFWKWLMLYAYRRWAQPQPKKPVGIPFNRDPDHPCYAFEPRPYQPGDWHDCQSDGHYLCKECPHLDRSEEEEEQGPLTVLNLKTK